MNLRDVVFYRPRFACVSRSQNTQWACVRECMDVHMHAPEWRRVCACLFSSLNIRVIVGGPSWPKAQPFAIFIVGNAATVKSNRVL